jgi:hypothetical protein
VRPNWLDYNYFVFIVFFHYIHKYRLLSFDLFAIQMHISKERQEEKKI